MTRVANLIGIGVLCLGLAGCGGFDMGLFDDGGRSRIAQVPRTVIVDSDDTVYSIARRYGLDPDEIIALNGLKPPHRLKKGSRLRLPRPQHHVVSSGDTLNAIAKAYDVSTGELANMNGLRSPYRLSVGQRLRIPGGASSGGNVVDNQSVAENSAKADPPEALPTPGRSSGSGFMWPAQGKLISRFGRKTNGMQNDGINIAVPQGASVRATENGVVAYAGNEIRGFGNLLLIKHSGGWVSAYGHAQNMLVKKGDKVKRGQVIAKAGSTGNVATPQLHFELRKKGKSVDPLRYLR